MVLAATSTQAPANPWPFLIVALLIIGTIGTGWIALWHRSDRKTDRPLDTPPWVDQSACKRVTAPVGAELPIRLAAEAVRRIGGFEITTIGESAVIGWLGPRQRSYRLPIQRGHQSYEVGIAIERASTSQATFTCCVRPRFRFGGAGGLDSERLANELGEQTLKLVEEGRA